MTVKSRLDTNNEFELTLHRLFGQRMRSDEGLCVALYSALTNIHWSDSEGREAAYSFREVGELIAALLDTGTYLDWYCSGPSGVVDPEISGLMAQEGWKHQPLTLDLARSVRERRP